MLTRAQLNFLDFAKFHHPTLYRAAQGKAGMALGDTATSLTRANEPPSTWDRLIQLAETYVTVDSQRRLFKMNLDRAARGLDPIDPSDVAPQVNVGLDSGTKKMMYLAVGGIIGAIVLPKLIKGRR